MNIRYLLVLAAAFSASVMAAEKPEVVFKDGNCNNCHAVESVMVGPTLVEIADKYRSDKDAQAKLEKKVRNGGSGSFGVMPMPGTRPAISDESIRMLVTWILEQKAKPKADDLKEDCKAADKSATAAPAKATDGTAQ